MVLWWRKELWSYGLTGQRPNDVLTISQDQWNVITKTCSACGRILTLDHFSVDRSMKDGLAYRCKDCLRISNKNWRETNKDLKKIQSKIYRDANKEKEAARAKKYREDHKESIAQKKHDQYVANPTPTKTRAKEWRINNPERKSAANQEWAKVNPEKDRNSKRKWKSENPERTAAAGARRRARKLGSRIEIVDRKLVLARSNSICYLCGKIIYDKLHIDHITPLARGGSETMDNLASTHARCNFSKRDKLLCELSAETQEIAKRELTKIGIFKS